MNPVAFSIFGLEVRWYGLLIAAAMFIASSLLVKWGKQKGYKENHLYDLVLVVIPAAIIGARLYYVAFNWSYYSGDLMKILNTRSGGLAIHGGVIGGLLAGYIYCRIRKLNFFELADMVAPGLILGQAIGRWGNFANQEAHGGPTDLPWGIMVDGMKVHPTFLYEFIWNMLVFAVLLFFRKKKKVDGEVFLLYWILYSIGRFFIEGLRTDSLMLGEFRVAQLISIAIIVGCSGYFYYRRNKNKEI